MKYLVAIGCSLILCLTLYAHFQVVKPNEDVLENPGKVDLEILFTHPMSDGPMMNMEKVKRFGVQLNGKKTDLTKELKETKRLGKRSYTASYEIKRPGDYIFYLEPAPYWEPLERKMIIHYTKVCVSAMGVYEGWDDLIGFPVEIEPLSRPYGLYTGNAFRGIVRHDGKPVPFATVEIEYMNDARKYVAPNESYVTQIVKADKNGVFSYTMPMSGWWGFAALIDGEEKLENPKGKKVDVELGGLIWVRCRDVIKKADSKRD